MKRALLVKRNSIPFFGFSLNNFTASVATASDYNKNGEKANLKNNNNNNNKTQVRARTSFGISLGDSELTFTSGNLSLLAVSVAWFLSGLDSEAVFSFFSFFSRFSRLVELSFSAG